MNPFECFLLSIYDKSGDQILKVALRVRMDALTQDERDYPMEPETRNKLHALLPLHVRSCGPIVDIENIFEVVL